MSNFTSFFTESAETGWAWKGMRMIKVVITANNVSEVDIAAVKMLTDAGFEVEEYADAAQYPEDELITLLKDADAVIAGGEKYSKEIIDRMPKLKMIARRGVGIDNIDQETVKARKIEVSRTVGCVGDAVAELVMAYILEYARKLSAHNTDMKNGLWSQNIGSGLTGKTLGIIGFGSIGRATAVRADAFGMRVLCWHRHSEPDIEKKYHAEYADFDAILKESDYISVSVPLAGDTRNMFCKTVFDRMKPNAVLINTARGPVVNAADLEAALREKKIGGACIDVFDQEPCEDSPLKSFDNVILTPHIGTFTRETFTAMNNYCAKAIIEFFNK